MKMLSAGWGKKGVKPLISRQGRTHQRLVFNPEEEDPVEVV
jgi:hypothetical protein